MKHRSLILVLLVLLTLEVGYWTGYRARISEEPAPIHSTLAWR